MKPFYCLILLLCFFNVQLMAQSVRITGKVTATGGSPLQGVTVTSNGGSTEKNQTITDARGAYTINVNAEAKELVFTYVGMQPRTEIIRGRTTIDVQLSEASGQMDQVVVTALGIKREAKALSYSRQSMDVSTLTEAPTPNIVSSLSGRISGVQVTPPSTNTGSARIIIRGNNSILGDNQPLFVIDGIPVDNQTGDGGVSVSSNKGLDYGNVAANINPEDIESIDVLKGPNAAALYGSRAANGVVLITTKKASAGSKFKVSFNSNTTFQRINEFFDYQNVFGAGNSFKLEGSGSTSNPDRIPDLSVFYRSWGPPMMGQEVISINGQRKRYLPQPNNVEAFYKSAGMYTNSIAVEGGTVDNNYRLSYTNYYGGSVVKGINENVRHNANFRILNKLTPWLDLDSKLTFINNKVTNRQYMNGSDRNPVYQYAYMVRDDQLSEFENYKDQYGKETNTHRDFMNPYWAINENPNQDTKNQLLGAFNLNVKFNNWLKMTGKLGTEMYWLNGYTFNNKGAQGNPNGSMTTINNTLQSTNADLIVFANKKFGDISVNSFVGGGRFKTNMTQNAQSINSLIQPGLKNLANSSEYPAVSQFESDKIIYSAYGSVSTGYKNYLYVDVTGRNDWSSTLPSANNSYFYPSVGGSFVFTDAFKLSKKILSFGKLRASYAIVGNDTRPYQLKSVYSFNGIYNSQAFAMLSSTYFNPDLKPEKTRSVEYGVDLRFLNDRVTLGATHYKTSTVNQILPAQITPSSGFTRRYFNAGEIQNWGNEISLSAIPVKTRDFTWNITTNWARNNSKVVSLVEGVSSFQLNSWYGRLLVFAEEGQPYGIIRGAGWKRDSLGRKLVAASGLPIAESNLVLGNAMPDWTGGISNSFQYKKFSFSFLIDIRKGGEFYSGTYRRAYIAGSVASTLEGREDYYLHNYIYGESSGSLTGGFIYKDAYFEDGTPNNVYVTPQSNGFSNLDEMQIFDASFVKVRELVVGYTLPSAVLKKSFISNAKISLSGRNLWTIHKNAPKGIDPEASVTSGNGQGIEYGSLPPFSTYGIDIRLTF